MSSRARVTGYTVALTVAVGVPAGCGSNSPIVEEFAVEGTAKLVPDEGPGTTRTARPESPVTIDVHIDVSEPMGGFVAPPSNGDEFPVLRTVALNVQSHLARVYGSADIATRWFGVAHGLRELRSPPRIDRQLFDGRATRLDLSIAAIMSDLGSGRTEAAAVITDLMATGDLTGPLNISNRLEPWLQSADVQSGDYHVGLLGVRARYWGIASPGSCALQNGLGCWYDERAQEYRRVDADQEIPFYVLILGLGADRVKSVMDAVEAGIREGDDSVTVISEVLTDRPPDEENVAMQCDVAGRSDVGTLESQGALFWLSEARGQVYCQRDDPVVLSCNVMSGGFQMTGEPIVNGDTASAPVGANLIGDTLRIDASCEALRELSVEIGGEIVRPEERDWSEWTTEVDDLGRTLHLESFIQEIRLDPRNYCMTLSPLLPFGGLEPTPDLPSTS